MLLSQLANSKTSCKTSHEVVILSLMQHNSSYKILKLFSVFHPFAYTHGKVNIFNIHINIFKCYLFMIRILNSDPFHKDKQTKRNSISVQFQLQKKAGNGSIAILS